MYSQLSHLLFTEIYKISNIQRISNHCCCLKSHVGSRQKMMDMEWIAKALQVNAYLPRSTLLF